MKNNNISRRGFFSLNLKNTQPQEEKVKMLTADGKLVEVPKSALHSNSRKKASNQEILDWRKVDKNSKF